MDPISAVIIAAISAIGTAVGKEAVLDAYKGIKNRIKAKFGQENQVSKAIAEVEADPGSKGKQMVLVEQMAKAKVDQDKEIIKAAEVLMVQLKNIPEGEKHIMNVQGKFIAQADRGGTASITINKG